MDFLEFQGSNCLRQRIILATLTRRKIIIDQIRERNSSSYGVQKYEISLLKLIEKITNGSSILIDKNGTRITYKPGILYGGSVEHWCCLERSIGYYLEVLIPLAPYCKTPIEARLHGITNDSIDPSVDALRHSSIPLLRQFFSVFDEEQLELKIISRGLKPGGGGIVSFKSPIRKVLKPVHLMMPGKVKRIRGIAFATRVSPQIANRMVDTAKGMLLKFIPDIYIYTDHLKGKNSGKSPGFGLSLVAETTEGVFYVGEAMSKPAESGGDVSIPEDVAKLATSNLFNDIYRGGTINTINQGMAAIFMAFTDRDLSKVIFGPLSPYTIQLLRHLQTFTSLTFKLESEPLNNNSENNEEQKDIMMKIGSKKIIAACVGLGFKNLNKTVK
ncbi:hypothetical protein BLA29_004000 [Euroglyphus maynei]|uniref:RNA 3'-terminal phosphate cyclase-like protein n=1 Tax=Euroglyphus maynei TaxID=6958 RepID=A0A1Y3B2Z4_EURMA|nr:hypothetical protein BLA29_004000 [Euroglyphus maynei]